MTRRVLGDATQYAGARIFRTWICIILSGKRRDEGIAPCNGVGAGAAGSRVPLWLPVPGGEGVGGWGERYEKKL